MTNDWTTDQVLALAPDAGSAQAAKGLASAGKWVSLGRSDGAAWGECQGSGSKPYQARIDLNEPAFKCSCPSRKFPCKHALSLFLIFARDRSALKEEDPPAWVAEWLDARASRSQKKAGREAEGKAAPDPAQQARRAAGRESRVEQGIEELDLWLRDLVRHGLAWAQSQPMTFWTGVAARMVDAQAPGLARQIREMALVPASGNGWHARLLERLARLYLLVQAWRKGNSVPPDTREDIRTAIGFTQSQEEILARAGVAGAWLALSQEIEEDESGLRTQRIWLWGLHTSRPALLLAFAHRSAPAFDLTLPPGTVHEGEIVYYPGAVPLRAILKEHRVVERKDLDIKGHDTAAAALTAYADALARNPWIERFPMAIGQANILRFEEQWWLMDCERRRIPTRMRDRVGWNALALTGGLPCTAFGEWDGEKLDVKSIIFGGRFCLLA